MKSSRRERENNVQMWRGESFLIEKTRTWQKGQDRYHDVDRAW
jgi:hypothetical protein